MSSSTLSAPDFIVKVSRLTLSLRASVWRSSLILSFVSCYLMWGRFPSPRLVSVQGVSTILSALHLRFAVYANFAHIAITFMPQWHPLIVPRRGDMRAGYE